MKEQVDIQITDPVKECKRFQKPQWNQTGNRKQINNQQGKKSTFHGG